MALMLAACGGGDSGPPPTALPQSLSVAAPASQHAVGAAIAFASNAGDPTNTLRYRWEFGDGGAIVRSTDRGLTWIKVASPTPNGLNDVRFVSATTGYAVGELGTLLVTRDAGLSWTLQTTGVRANLQAVFFVDEQTGWVVGDNGNILATVSGGH
jgi:photosystem II stability/assembly factor-like uncharacterized protein